MTVADYEAAQRARDTHAALVEVVADHYFNTNLADLIEAGKVVIMQ